MHGSVYGFAWDSEAFAGATAIALSKRRKRKLRQVLGSVRCMAGTGPARRLTGPLKRCLKRPVLSLA